MIKIWDRFMSNKTAKGLDKGLVEIGNKMAVVQAQAIEQKAIVKAKTEAQVKEIRAAASVEDPQERRRKLAEFLNSLDTTR